MYPVHIKRVVSDELNTESTKSDHSRYHDPKSVISNDHTPKPGAESSRQSKKPVSVEEDGVEVGDKNVTVTAVMSMRTPE